MVIILCECSWGIPGVEQLPPHQHVNEKLVRRDADGSTFTMGNYFIPQAGYSVLSEHEGVHISIPWKRLCRLLTS